MGLFSWPIQQCDTFPNAVYICLDITNIIIEMCVIVQLEEESKFTKSIRLTASLILYNLLISSPRTTE